MVKLVTFTDNDEALIAKIKEYQKPTVYHHLSRR